MTRLGAFAPGSYVTATTDDGTGLNIRADGAPDAEEIGIVPESDVVQVMDGPYYDPIGNPWYMITNGQVTLKGQTTVATYGAGTYFDVPADSGFTIEVSSGLCEYICSFLP